MLVADDGRILLADFGACATLEREARLPSLESALSKDAVTPSESPSGQHLKPIIRACWRKWSVLQTCTTFVFSSGWPVT